MNRARSIRRFAGNYLSTMSFIGLSFWIVSDLSGFHQGMLQGQWQFGMFDVDAVLRVHTLFLCLIALYAVVLVPYYLRYPWLHSKASLFLQGLWFSLTRKRLLSPAAQQAGLALLLKFFFAPLMINWCLNHVADMANSVVQLLDGLHDGVRGRELFDTWLFWACFQLILFVDTLLFTLGYIIEIPALRNRIKSVDPTFFGWFICLACYPPFNDFTSRWLEWQSSDFPHFEDNAVHYVANTALLAALAIYSWASIALGFKASNLTNRGIVSRGPYKYVRHPAYVAKNCAWWIGAMPHLYTVFTTGTASDAAYSVIALAGWSLIYALRAITEERHLLLAGNGYAEYRARVRWRFIPGLA